MLLTGRRAMVTGAADGLGRAIAERFSEEGARLLLLDVDAQKAEAVAARLRDAGRDAIAFGGSVAEEDVVGAAFAEMDARFGGIDILVNNAGVNSNGASASLATAEWDRVTSINLRGSFLCARAAGERMLREGSGAILNIASIYGVTPAPERLAYCVTKSGVAMMARALAAEWSPLGIRVNAIAPGYISTPAIASLAERGLIDLERLEHRTPIRRLAAPAEIAGVAAFLCSSQASYITGQVIGADGGWTAYGYI